MLVFIWSIETFLNWKMYPKQVKRWTKEHNFTFLIFEYKIYARLQIIPCLVLRLHSDLKLIYLRFRGFHGLCHLLDYLSARRGDLQRQPAPKWLGLYLVVQHADDRAQGMDNTSTFVLGGKQPPHVLASAYPREPLRARCWGTRGIIQVLCQGS